MHPSNRVPPLQVCHLRIIVLPSILSLCEVSMFQRPQCCISDSSIMLVQSYMLEQCLKYFLESATRTMVSIIQTHRQNISRCVSAIPHC